MLTKKNYKILKEIPVESRKLNENQSKPNSQLRLLTWLNASSKKRYLHQERLR